MILITKRIVSTNGKKESQSIPSTGSVMVVVFPCPAQLKALNDSKCVVVSSTAQSSDGGSGGGDVTLLSRRHMQTQLDW